MVLRSDQQQIKALLTETMILLCKNGLNFSSELTVEGLFGITVDHKEVLLININETIKVPASTDSMDINQLPGLDTCVENCVVEKEGPVFNRRGNHSVMASSHLDADSYLHEKNIEETAVFNNCANQLSNRHCSISSLDYSSAKTRRKTVHQSYKSSESYSHSDGAKTRCKDASSLKAVDSAVINSRHFSSPCCQRQCRLDDVVHVPTFCVGNVSTNERVSPETVSKPDCSPGANSSSNNTRQTCGYQADYIKLEDSNDAQLFSHQSAGVSDDGSQGAAAQSTVCPKEGVEIDEGQSAMCINDMQAELMPGIGEVELVPGFGVFVSQRFFRQYCRDGQFTLNGSQLVRRLVRELFPDDRVIAASSCCGNKNKRTSSFALDRQKIEAIKEFMHVHCPSMPQSKVVRTVNEFCRDVRRQLRRKQKHFESNSLCVPYRQTSFQDSHQEQLASFELQS